jgi:hypothetical protein
MQLDAVPLELARCIKETTKNSITWVFIDEGLLITFPLK